MEENYDDEFDSPPVKHGAKITGAKSASTTANTKLKSAASKVTNPGAKVATAAKEMQSLVNEVPKKTAPVEKV